MSFFNRIWEGFIEQSRNTGTVVAIFGPTGSGKSYIRDIFVQNGWEKIISHTTRKLRDESEEKEYIKTDLDSFFNLMNAERFVNTNSYLGQWYGIDVHNATKDGKSLEDVSKGVLITDKSSALKVEKELEEMGKKVIIVYVTGDIEALEAIQKDRLRSGEYEEPEAFLKRIKQLEKEFESEIKQKAPSLADIVINNKFNDETATEANELAQTLGREVVEK